MEKANFDECGRNNFSGDRNDTVLSGWDTEKRHRVWLLLQVFGLKRRNGVRLGMRGSIISGEGVLEVELAFRRVKIEKEQWKIQERGC